MRQDVFNGACQKPAPFYIHTDIPILKDLIELKMVNYVPLSVQRIGIAEEIDTGVDSDEGD